MKSNVFNLLNFQRVEVDFSKPESQSSFSLNEPASLLVEDIEIQDLNNSNLDIVVSLIRQSLGAFEEAGTVLASSYRRTDAMLEVYGGEAAKFLVAFDRRQNRVIGGAGIGPLAGLPPSEGICEIRELVIEESYRGRGIGKMLLSICLETAKKLNYQRIYLETTPQMVYAQKLFRKFGFRPVTSALAPNSLRKNQDLPCYYLLEMPA
jgi:putative acetyltransferase